METNKNLAKATLLSLLLVCFAAGLGRAYGEGPSQAVLDAAEVIKEETPEIWKLDEEIAPLKKERAEREARLKAAYETIASECWAYDFKTKEFKRGDCPKDQPQ